LKPKTDPSGLYAILASKYTYSKDNTYNPAGKLNSIDYRQYLQIGNLQIKNMVNTIVTPADTNDQKADKILKWVQENVPYVSDEAQYHVPEYWAKPTETLKSRQADCEDQSFLIHSMLIAAGVPIDRIRTYGGLVEAGANAPLEGHAWTIYKRESDNQWVDLDACYYPDNTSVVNKEAFKAQDEYVDAYWWMNGYGTYNEYGKWGIDIYA
jgi:predicted transglutaminase-like cysteine proteinase